LHEKKKSEKEIYLAQLLEQASRSWKRRDSQSDAKNDGSFPPLKKFTVNNIDEKKIHQ
jgi:hypothetical protein